MQTSLELYGKAQQIPQNEDTPFHPEVLMQYKIICTLDYYKLSRGIWYICCNGILFNHESQEEVKHLYEKITTAMVKIKFGKQKTLYLGNLDSKRDWGRVELCSNDLVNASTKNLKISYCYWKAIFCERFCQPCSKKIKNDLKWSGRNCK